MSTLTFLLAVLALLVAPGPTNTLIGLAGARHGLRRVLALVPAELAGYLSAVLPLALLGAPLLAAAPALALVLKGVAALWVLRLACTLWQADASPEGAGARLTPGQIYVTTALNPKALVFALVLLPPVQEPAFLPQLGLFCLAVAAVALIWGGAGALTRRARSRPAWTPPLHRIAAAWLGFVALSLAFGALPT